MGDRRMLALLPLVLALGAAGCGGASTRAQEAVTVGVLVPLTSGVPTAARSAQQGAQLAADEVNSAPGGGATLVLIVEDYLGSPTAASRIFTQMVERRAAVVIGPLTDFALTAVAPLAERAGVAIISPGATGVIPYSGSSVFRTSLAAHAQARVLAEYVVRTELIRNIGIIHESNEYGGAVATAFAQRLQELGGTVVGTQLYRDGDTDFTRQALDTIAGGADAAFIAGYPDEGALIVRALRAHGFTGPILGSDALYSTDLLAWAGEAAEGVLLPAAFVSTERVPAVQEFAGKYRRKYGQAPDHYAAQAYDAIRIAAFAAKRGGRTPEAIRTTLRGLRRFPGATGEITFDRFGTPERPVAIARVKHGAFEIVQR
jgi:branched-chain amino acid transport system substrate-binding protein